MKKWFYNNVFICTLFVKAFKWMGSKLFTDEIEYRDGENISGIAFASDLNLVARFRQIADKINSPHE